MIRRAHLAFQRWWCRNFHSRPMFAGGSEWTCRTCLKRWRCSWALEDEGQCLKLHR